MKKSFGTVVRADARHSDHVTKALNELASQSDRSAAMVATAILNLVLTEALKSYLHTDTNIAAHFFAADGPVGDLGAKVDLAFLVGLVSETSWRDLVTIRNICNTFAHKMEISSFRAKSAAAQCNKLRIAEIRTFDVADKPKEWPKGRWMSVENRKQVLSDPRERFLLTVAVLCSGLATSRNRKVPPPTF